MGGGKGAPEQYVCTIKPGSIMFEIGGISPKNATEALKLAGHKLSVKSKVVDKK